jgi:RNA polymerase sigma-70 factor, ECF subfamily
MLNDKNTPEYLLSRTALKDKKAFHSLYLLTSAQLLATLFRIVKNKAIAEDLLQETFIKIWNKADSYHRSKAKAMTWMTSIARNLSIDYLRCQVNKQHENVDDMPIKEILIDLVTPEQKITETQSSQQIKHCLNQLDDQVKKVILLAYFNGLTHEDIFRQTGTPLGTIKSWIRRGLQKMKHCLEKS